MLIPLPCNALLSIGTQIQTYKLAFYARNGCRFGGGKEEERSWSSMGFALAELRSSRWRLIPFRKLPLLQLHAPLNATR